MAHLRITQSADNTQVNIIYRDCVTGRWGPFPSACFRFARNLYYVNLLCHSILVPLSYATVESAAAVGALQGPPGTQSVSAPRTSRLRKSTVVRNSRARGPPRGNFCGTRISSPAFSIKCGAGKLPPPHFVQGRSGLLLHILRELRISSISPPLQGKATPCFYTARLILSRSVLHSATATFRTHLPRASRKARLFPLVRDSQAVSLSGRICRA